MRLLTRARIVFTLKGCPMHVWFPFPGEAVSLHWQQPSGAAAKPDGTATSSMWGGPPRTNPLISARRNSLSSLCEGKGKSLELASLTSRAWCPVSPHGACPQLHMIPQQSCSHTASASVSFKCTSLVAWPQPFQRAASCFC